MQKSQNGFVLISVLLITTISTVYAFSEIKGNRLQEKIGGNQQKEMNARMLAEKGALEGYAYIKNRNKNNIEPDEIKANFTSYIGGLALGLTVPSVSFTPLTTVSGATFTFVSKGEYQGATAYFKTEVNTLNLGGESVFTDAVVGCDGITVSAGGVINSYRSTDGIYDPISPNSGANVSTINANSDIDISGGVSVKGSVDANGSIIAGANSIAGDVKAQGNIDIAGGVSPLTGRIGGNIHAGGNVTLGYIPIDGGIQAGGDFTHGWGDNTGDNPDPEQMITGNVTYKGDYTKPGGYGNVAASTNTDLDIVPPTLTTDTCDPLDVVNNLPQPVSSSPLTPSTEMNTGNGGALRHLIFNESYAEMLSGPPLTPGSVKSKLLDKDLEAKDVYVLEHLNLANTMVEISGDVVLYLKGDLTTSGGGSGFKFADGDSTSSLTIITEGTINISSDATVFAGFGVNSQKEPPLTVFSSKDSDDAFTFSGDTQMYGKIYAPLGKVNIGASAGLMGAVRGREVSVTGAGGIHYDEVLGDIIDISDPDSGKANVIASYYYYP